MKSKKMIVAASGLVLLILFVAVFSFFIIKTKKNNQTVKPAPKLEKSLDKTFNTDPKKAAHQEATQSLKQNSDPSEKLKTESAPPAGVPGPGETR